MTAPPSISDREGAPAGGGSASPRATTIVRASARSCRPAASGAPTVTPARTSAIACVSGSVSAQTRGPTGMAASGNVTPLNAAAGPKISAPRLTALLRSAVRAMISRANAWLASTNAAVATISSQAGPRTGMPYQTAYPPKSTITSRQCARVYGPSFPSHAARVEPRAASSHSGAVSSASSRPTA